MRTIPSPSYSITLRLEIENRVGLFGNIGTAIGEVGGDIGAVDIVKVGKGVIVRDFTINARDEAHENDIVDAVKKIEGVRVIHVSDRTFLLHHCGKIEIHNKVPVKNRNDLSRIYTPGVARGMHGNTSRQREGLQVYNKEEFCRDSNRWQRCPRSWRYRP